MAVSSVSAGSVVLVMVIGWLVGEVKVWVWVWVWEVRGGRDGVRYLESETRCVPRLRIACSVVLTAGGASFDFDEDKAGRSVRTTEH